MAHRTAPWQNRPSLISCWEHTVSGFDLSGDPVLDLDPLITKDNLVIHGGLPICIPRACRLTRMCLTLWFAFNTEPADESLFLDLEKSVDCTSDWTIEDNLEFELGPESIVACYCEDLNVLFDECDQWRPSFDLLFGGLEFPIFRMNFHFELR